MQATHVLVDLENNQPTLDDVKRLVPEVTHAWLFHSRSQVKRLASFAPLGAEQTPVPISRPGKNALDFHLAFYVGYIASRNAGARIVIVAIDRGYGPMIEHAVSLGFDVVQVPFKPSAAPAKKAAGKKAAVRKGVARKTTARVVPAKKVAAVVGASGAEAPAAKRPRVSRARKADAPPVARAPIARAPIARAPIAGAPVAVTAPPITPAAPSPKAKAPAGKATAKQPQARKAAAKNGAVKTGTAKKATAPSERAARKATAPVAGPRAASVESPARKAAPTRTKAAPQPKAREKPGPLAQAGQRAPTQPPAAEKVLANLRTMGEKLPKKLRQLRRYVSSMLGTGEADPAVGRLVDHLVAVGFVRVKGEALAYAPAAGPKAAARPARLSRA